MSFLDKLFGVDKARGDIDTAFRQSQATLDNARNTGRSDITGGRDSAMGTINPWIEQGQRGYGAYQDALGLNGLQARQRAFQTGYMDDPARAMRDQNAGFAMNALLRKYNAGGQGVNSGAAMAGLGRLNAEMFNQDWGYLDRLAGMGQMGQRAAQFGAGIQYGAGKDLADLEMGYGNTAASNQINYGNALARTRGLGVQNLIGAVGSLGQAYGSLRFGAKR